MDHMTYAMTGYALELEKWSRQNSVTIEADCDNKGRVVGDCPDVDSVLDVLNIASSEAYTCLLNLEASGNGIVFGGPSRGFCRSITEIGVYTARHADRDGDLFTVWVVPKAKPTPAANDTPEFKARLAVSDVAAYVRELRLAARETRAQADACETELNLFIESIESAMRAQP
jgi:hypothetical protein